jgi:hypothetical protein
LIFQDGRSCLEFDKMEMVKAYDGKVGGMIEYPR